ncbi:hypothetical protein A3F64_01010 [Candidatus Saccharibacteria bacterium RIFCSPHIGHO2_12_FULL_42_8]|nr:MAG: hypothetical protein A3F64_01010 [Candidatus Saccharibacteria bacterium RIFCSPHIGHO2_12_FULL_42_8]
MSGRGKLWTPQKTDSFGERRRNTPVDDRGIVEIDRLLLTVKNRMVFDELFLPGEGTDVHHFYYPKARYRTDLEFEFRELPPNKGRLPRGFHKKLHESTSPPLMPDAEVMKSFCESWDIAESLLRAARQIKRHERKSNKVVGYAFKRLDKGNIEEEVVEDVLERHFAKNRGSEVWFGRKLEAIADMPVTFTEFPLDDLRGRVSADTVLVLGGAMLSGSYNLTQRMIRLEAQSVAA